MEVGLFPQIGIGACFGLAAIGSGFGFYAVGSAVMGAWKKCYIEGKQAPFLLVVYAAQPLTQNIYGFILMQALANSTKLTGYQVLGMGLFSGIAMGISAWVQGRVSAAAADTYAETEQGFVNSLLVLGLIETLALFVMVFSMLMT